jgi:peroxiredoxin
VLEVGAVASHFTLLGVDGKEYSLPAALEERPAILVFGKTGCGACDLAFPYLNRLRVAYPDGWGLWVILQDQAKEAREYAKRMGIGYPVLIDAPRYEVSRLYDPPATPTLFLVGTDGRIAYTTHGFSKDDLNEISARLAGCLGMEAVKIAPADDGKPAFKPG